MAGLFDWARLLTGDSDNPEEDIGQWSDQQQRQNRTALGLDANGNPIAAPAAAPADPNAPAASAAPSSGAQAAAQAQASSTLPPGQEPNATKTPVSLGHLMMNLPQYNEREQGFNQALGMGFAAFAQPRDRDMVSKMFNVTPADPLRTAQTQMSLGMQQQGQDRMNALGQMLTSNDPAMQAQAQQIANSLNIPLADLKARYLADPQGVGAMIQNFRQPTDQLKNLQQITDYQNQYKQKHPDATPGELDSIAKAITAGIGGPAAEQMIADQRAYRQKFGVDPSWKDNPDAYKSYVAQQGARAEALNIRATSEDKVNDLESKVDAIKNDPALPGLMKRLLPGQGILSLVGYNDAERQLLQKIKQATSDEYVRGLSDPGLGTRKTQQEMQYVGQSLGGVLNATNINVNDYKAGLGRLQDQLYRTHADIYGQSGSFNGMDPKYAGYVNDVYRPGGALNEGIEGAPARQPLDDEAKQFWQTNVAKGVSKTALIEHLRNLNYDTTGLK
jgi:hypothetical protein